MIILGPLESFSVLCRTGALPTQISSGAKAHIRRQTAILPLPQIVTNQAQILEDPPSVSKATEETLKTLGVHHLARQGKYTAVVNAEALRRHSRKLRSLMIGGRLPAKSILEIGEGVFIPCPALCLILLAKNHNVSDADLAFAAYEFCSRYAYSSDPVRELIEIVPLTNTQHISNYLMSIKKINRQAPDGLRRLERVLPFVHNGTRSPFEIVSDMFMGWPIENGGLEITPFEVNQNIDLSPQEQMELGKRNLEVDFLWREQHLVLEYNGGVHNFQRDSDSARINVLRDKGYAVETLSKQVLKNHDSYIKFMKRLEESLGFEIKTGADARNKRRAFQQHVIDIAEHRSILRI